MTTTSKAFKTLDSLPDVSGKRFGALSVGYENATAIRDEFSLLRAVAAACCGKDPEALTVADVEALDLSRVSEACASLGVKRGLAGEG